MSENREKVEISRIVLPSLIVSTFLSLFTTFGARLFLFKRWGSNSFLGTFQVDEIIYYLCIVITVSLLFITLRVLKKLRASI